MADEIQKIQGISQPVPGYHVGEYGRRPWGSWVVTRVSDSPDGGRNLCEKIIVVDPGNILSLQSHELRCETWTVLDGILIAIVDGECSTLHCGHSMEIPAGTIHSMANPGEFPCIVKELQTGICMESDITRYKDIYGRLTSESGEAHIINIYSNLIEQIKKTGEQHVA
jgi:mannose-6-phosphate isomerase-like protein (cupin superfamily)